MRKSIPVKIRKQVYAKFNGHCAYCGCELNYKDMQIDHINSVMYHGGTNEIENLNPACRMCNFYKSTFGIETLRKQISGIQERLKKIFIYRLALKYGLVEEKNNKIVFYFEKAN